MATTWSIVAMSVGGWVAIGVLAVVVLFVILAYNGLVGARNRVRNAYSQIDVQLKRRYDLIPNLVDAWDPEDGFVFVDPAADEGLAYTYQSQEAFVDLWTRMGRQVIEVML